MELQTISPNINMNKSHSMKQEEEKLIEIAAANRQRVIRNNLYLITFINFITIIMFIISMSYYQWVEIQFVVEKKRIQTIWINLLYMYHHSYMTFNQYTKITCSSLEDVCASILQQLGFIGILSFLVFLIAHVLQLIDIFVFLWKMYKKLPLTASNFFRQVFIICTFSYGIGIYSFSMTFIKNVQKITYGVCIYLTIVSIGILLAVVVYQQISIRKMMKAELISRLLQQQKQYDDQQTDKYSINRHSDSFVL